MTKPHKWEFVISSRDDAGRRLVSRGFCKECESYVDDRTFPLTSLTKAIEILNSRFTTDCDLARRLNITRSVHDS